MNDSKKGLDEKQVEIFANLSEKVYHILNELGWKYAKTMEIPCNYLYIDIRNLNISFINKTILGDKRIADIFDIPYRALSYPEEWLKDQIEKTVAWNQEIEDRIEKRKKIQEERKENAEFREYQRSKEKFERTN